jgi:hypothetical protein
MDLYKEGDNGSCTSSDWLCRRQSMRLEKSDNMSESRRGIAPVPLNTNKISGYLINGIKKLQRRGNPKQKAELKLNSQFDSLSKSIQRQSFSSLQTNAEPPEDSESGKSNFKCAGLLNAVNIWNIHRHGSGSNSQ